MSPEVKPTGWPRRRKLIFGLANAVVFFLALFSISTGGSLVGAMYTVVLFALCSAPLLLLDQLNGRYALLAVFMAIYFVFYGMLDLVTLLKGADGLSVRPDGFTAGELGILTGAVLVLLSYRVAVQLADPPERAAADYSPRTLRLVGTALWLLGSAAYTYFQVFVLFDKSNLATARGLASMGPTQTFFVLLANMLQPVGVLFLAYGYARYRTISWTGMIIAAVLLQVCIGFLSDVKSEAMLAGVLVIFTKTLIDNRLPKAWLVGAAAFIVVAFPIFVAYRAEITGERGLNRTEAAMEIGKVLDIVLSANEKAEEKGKTLGPSFFERSSLKSNVELTFDKTGVDVPFQQGLTMIDLPFAFIPRIIWPDKPAVPAGQLFNKQFYHGTDDTYISPSHLGELYWNFGWTGVFFGMTLIGTILGVIGARTNLAKSQSLTRLLVLVVTIKGVCMGFEGAIAVAYVIWLRSLGAVVVLHLIFARAASRESGADRVHARAPEPVRYSNFIRS